MFGHLLLRPLDKVHPTLIVVHQPLHGMSGRAQANTLATANARQTRPRARGGSSERSRRQRVKRPQTRSANPRRRRRLAARPTLSDNDASNPRGRRAGAGAPSASKRSAPKAEKIETFSPSPRAAVARRASTPAPRPHCTARAAAAHNEHTECLARSSFGRAASGRGAHLGGATVTCAAARQRERATMGQARA